MYVYVYNLSQIDTHARTKTRARSLSDPPLRIASCFRRRTAISCCGVRSSSESSAPPSSVAPSAAPPSVPVCATSSPATLASPAIADMRRACWRSRSKSSCTHLLEYTSLLYTFVRIYIADQHQMHSFAIPHNIHTRTHTRSLSLSLSLSLTHCLTLSLSLSHSLFSL